MTWTEQTVINPSAWSRRVEWDLLQSTYRQFADETPAPELQRFNSWREGKGWGWTADEMGGAQQHEEVFTAACMSARSQLASADHVPHVVTLTHDGVAKLDVADLNELADEQRHLLQRGVSGGATAPSFSNAVNLGSGLVPATLDTSLTAPTNTTTIITAGSSSTKAVELVCQGVGTTVAAVVNVFLHDGSTANLYDQFLITAVTSSTTAQAYRLRKQYADLIVKNGWTLKVSNTVAGNQSLIKVTAIGGDF